jgi:hypothetical protein
MTAKDKSEFRKQNKNSEAKQLTTLRWQTFMMPGLSNFKKAKTVLLDGVTTTACNIVRC